mmetsp:Transcript_106588/g.206476  ORF Transcript_106588/g.206476 Transcript_106588/m.206476 type:complete len:123 (-) Transcript_106588:3-371(-)
MAATNPGSHCKRAMYPDTKGTGGHPVLGLCAAQWIPTIIAILARWTAAPRRAAFTGSGVGRIDILRPDNWWGGSMLGRFTCQRQFLQERFLGSCSLRVFPRAKCCRVVVAMLVLLMMKSELN